MGQSSGLSRPSNVQAAQASSGPKRARKATDVSFLKSGRSGMAPKTATGGYRSSSKNKTSASAA